MNWQKQCIKFTWNWNKLELDNNEQWKVIQTEKAERVLPELNPTIIMFMSMVYAMIILILFKCKIYKIDPVL